MLLQFLRDFDQVSHPQRGGYSVGVGIELEGERHRAEAPLIFGELDPVEDLSNVLKGSYVSL